MQALSEGITYTELLGTSGLAFRLQVHKELCPSSPHAFCGRQCVDGSAAALPWEMRVFRVKEDDAEGVRTARKAVKGSIDRGIPVVYGSEEDGLIVGYQKDGEEWIVYHPMKKGGREMVVETNWPWGIAVFTERKEQQADRRELAVSALELAIEMAEADDVEEYTLGKRAWDTWLGRLTELQTADVKTCGESMMGNSWIYTTLVEYRTQASQYLRSVADLFDADVSTHLLAAADAYEEMATRILTDDDACALDVAPTPWYLKDREWDSNWRTKQIERLEKARPLEEKALTEIELALAELR